MGSDPLLKGMIGEGVPSSPGDPSLEALLVAVRACTVCAEALPLGARPVLVADSRSRILIVGQAPGIHVHRTGIPWNDRSGERLREWTGLTREIFYDPSVVSIIPMGYCYPGSGSRGDLPPRKECAALWLESLLGFLPRLSLRLLVGQYAQRYFLGGSLSLTERIIRWKSSPDNVIPLPHPSPRNALWLSKNPWFVREVLPEVKHRIRSVLDSS